MNRRADAPRTGQLDRWGGPVAEASRPGDNRRLCRHRSRRSLSPKEVQLVVAKKTSRTAKSAVPAPVTPVDKASIEGARRPRAAKFAAPKTDATLNGAKPKVSRAKRTPAAPTTVEAASVMVPSAITDEDIRVRAYFLSVEHRGQGSAEYFWHLAERELRGISR